jgi:hypothetical protein
MLNPPFFFMGFDMGGVAERAAGGVATVEFLNATENTSTTGACGGTMLCAVCGGKGRGAGGGSMTEGWTGGKLGGGPGGGDIR